MSPQQLFAWRREARSMFSESAQSTTASATCDTRPAFAPVVTMAPAGSPPSIPPKGNAPGIIEIVIGAVTVRVIGLVATEAIATAVRAVRRSS